MRFVGIILLWLACFIQCIVPVLALQTIDDQIESIMSSMSLHQKINQMAQIDFSLIFTDSNVDQGKLEHYFGRESIGSLLLVPVQKNSFDASFYRDVMERIQNVTKAYNLPPVIAGIDSVHGANYVKGAIIFPQQINIASTFNPMHAKYAGKIAARDSLAGGINWVFSPILGLGIQPLWARMFETFGEDPHVVGQFATKMVEGIQENSRSAACAKHFVGYSAPRDGHDRSPSWIPVRHLYQYFVRPWRDVIQNARPLTIMESYSEYDGVPNAANRNSLQTLLRQDLGFDGVLVTDYHEVENLFEFHHVAADNNEAVKMTLLEGSVDMSMLPFNIDRWMNGVTASVDEAKERGTVEKRINRSVQRILQLKQQLGMFDDKMFDDSLGDLEKIGDPEVRKAALTMAHESIVLAKNRDRTLPILMGAGEDKVKVHVTGPTSNYLTYQSGGWTIEWNGARSDQDFTYGQTVLHAANSNSMWDVTSSCGVDILGYPCNDENVTIVKEQRAEADYIIVCIGEENYSGKLLIVLMQKLMLLLAYFLFLTNVFEEKPGDIRDLFLAQGQRDFVHNLKESTNAKIIVVYFGGRPRLLGNIVDIADAIALAFLPGPDAGQAVVDLIAGKQNFSGRLPITYPKYEDMGGVPYWRAVSDQCTGPNDSNEPLPHYWYKKCDVEWEFGHGLSYTTFEYNDLRSDSAQIIYALPWSDRKSEVSANFSVKVKNTGDRTGMETVMFFIFVESRHVTPESKLLLHFERVELLPGEEKTVDFHLTPKLLRYVGPHDDRHDILQKGEKFRIRVGPSGLCSDFISLAMSDEEDYDPACERA